MPWYLFALGAAVIWGIHYLLLARAMTIISPITAYWLPTIIMIAGLPLFYKTIWTDFINVYNAGWDVKVPVLILAFTSCAASLMLYKAIQLHNPVHAALIEITYPIFLTIFAFVLYQQNHLNISTILGGSLILAGSAVIKIL